MKIVLFTILLFFIAQLNYAQDSLKILSWNLHLLPAPVFTKSKKKLRVDSIIKHFTVTDTSIDILLFQEVFHRNRRQQLIDGLKTFYPHYTSVANSARGKLLKTNSGLIIFSKTPLVEINTIKYDNCSGSDCMAFKGAQFIHTVWNNVPLLIINTHLNSEPPRRIALEQSRKIIDQLVLPYEKMRIPTFIGGDFNISCSDSTNYEKLLSIVGSNNRHHENIVCTKNPKSLKNTLDYIFVYNEWLPDYFTIDYLYKYLIGPTWQNSDKKKIYGQTVGFSDHHAVVMKLNFQK